MDQNYSVPTSRLRILIETASEYEGVLSARSYDRGAGDVFHPGDPWGNTLCDAWQLDRLLAAFSAVAFMAGLRNECDRLEIEPPTWTTVADHIPWAVNTGLYPDVSVQELTAYLRDEVPGLFGASI